MQETGGKSAGFDSPSLSFFVSDAPRVWQGAFKDEPLTLTRFARAVAVNFVLLNYWKGLRFLVWRLNAFDFEEAEMIHWAKFKPFLLWRKFFSKFGKKTWGKKLARARRARANFFSMLGQSQVPNGTGSSQIYAGVVDNFLRTSSLVAVAVPSLPTTIPAATFAK